MLRHLSQNHTNISFVNTKAACKQLGVGAATLRRWDKDGKIKTMRTPGIVALNTRSAARKESTGWKRVCQCGANVDRDLNGARGIFLRALAVTP